MPSTVKKIVAIAGLIAPFVGLMALGAAFLVARHGHHLPSCYIAASTLELPMDGTPLLKQVYAKRFDAWQTLPDEQVSEVFVRMVPDTQQVLVLSAWHDASLRIPIRYDRKKHIYVSCCRNDTFDLDGRNQSGREPNAARSDLAKIPVQVFDDGKRWICLDPMLDRWRQQPVE